MQADIRFIAICLLLAANMACTNYGFQQLKTDPICENARAALDTINAQREIRHVNLKKKTPDSDPD